METKINVAAYYRTSSATNVGVDKDSKKRQADSCLSFANKNNMIINNEFYDPAVKGSDAVINRPGFSEMLNYMAGNNINTILIENVNRFSRDLIVQLTGYEYLKKCGIILIPVDCQNHFQEDTPTAVMVRQILGAVAEFEKTSLVEKLRKARDRKRRETGRCEGRKPAPIGAIELAKQCNGLTLRQIGDELLLAGFSVMKKDIDGKYAKSGLKYGPSSVRCMLRSKS